MEITTNDENKNILMLNAKNTGSSSRIESCRLFMGLKHKEKWFIKNKHSNLNELSNIIDINNYSGYYL